MWDFPQYTFEKKAFNFSQGILETVRVEVGAGAGAEAKARAGMGA